MAEADRSLSLSRTRCTEAMTTAIAQSHRLAIAVVAKQRAVKAVQQQLQSQGQRWRDMDRREAIAGQQPLRVRDRSRHSGYDSLVLADGRANRQGRKASLPCASAHAAAFDGI